MRQCATRVQPMEEPGEQCNVVFALIVTEPAGEWLCVCVCGGGGALAGSVSINAKTTVHIFQVCPWSCRKRASLRTLVLVSAVSARICKRLWSPVIDSEESMPLGWRAGTT